MIAPNKSGESGEPCLMPFDWGTGVITSPTATFSARRVVWVVGRRSEVLWREFDVQGQHPF